MKFLTWQNPEQLFVAQELINKVKSKCCGIKENLKKLAEKWKATVIGGQALGDASIVEVVKYYTDLGYQVEIFTGDEGLKAYEPTVEIPRRRRK